MELNTWTDERVELLTSLWEEGLPAAEIGRRLGLTKNAVIGKVHRIALSPRVVTVMAAPRRNPFDFTGPACMWPHGHPSDPDFRFCGAQPETGKPYCSMHASVAYVRLKDDKPQAA